VTIATRPSIGVETGGFREMFCPTAKGKYFSQQDWAGQITLIRFNKFARRA
jgi:hypothetical protein